MVGAGGMVRANPMDDRAHVAPGDDGVHQPITAAIFEVLIAEAQSA
jgi:hypothetical protein